MSTPAVIYLSIVLMSGFLSPYKHGKPKTENESFWDWLISCIIILSLLYWGGFFN